MRAAHLYLIQLSWRLALFFLCAISLQWAKAQENLKITPLDNSNGLSQNSVYSILQDNEGFMWFATENGLNRFDGKIFKTYTHEPGDNTSIAGSFVWPLFQDHRNRLWIGSYGRGLSLLDKKSGRFYNYCDSSDLKKFFENNAIWTIAQGSQPALWLGTFGAGLKKFDLNSRSITQHYTSQNSGLKGNDIRTIVASKNGKLWLGTFDAGLIRFDPKTARFENFVAETGKSDSVIFPNKILCLTEDLRNHCLWIGTHGNGLWKLDLNTNKLSRVADFNSRFLRSILPDPKRPELLWIATWGEGVAVYNIRTTTSDYYNTTGKTTIPDLRNLCLLADRSGLIWMGSYNAGICKISTQEDKFLTVPAKTENEPGLSNPVVYSACRFGDTLWVGTNGGGLNRVVLKEPAFSVYGSDPKNRKEVIYCLTKDGAALWAGSNNGVTRIDTRTGLSKRYVAGDKPGNLTFNIITFGYKDRQGTLWFGTYGNGLTRYNRLTETFTPFRADQKPYNENQTSPANVIFSMLDDASGHFWIGTGGDGLYCLNRKNGSWTALKHPYIGAGQTITSLAEDLQGRIWISTTNGLIRMTPNGKIYTLTNYTKKNGLPSNSLGAIKIDRRNRLWVSSTSGIFSFEQTGNRPPIIHTYKKQDGIKNMEFQAGAGYQDEQGNIYFGSVEGLVMFNPEKIRSQGVPPQVALTSFTIFNHPVSVSTDHDDLVKIGDAYFLPSEINHTRHLTLSYHESVFSIDFASLDFLHPENNAYAYKMDGFEPEWNYVGQRNTATYTNLPPGTYTFRVKGSNGDGIWSTKEAILEITVTPPWWETWEFRFAAAFVLIFTTVYLIRKRIGNLKRDKLILEEKVSERTVEINQQKDQLQVQASKLQKVNEKLVELDAFKENLTTMLVHDLKNPLGSIVNLSKENIRENNSSLIELSAKHMLTLVMNILDVQKIKDSRLVLNLQDHNLNNLVRNSATYLALSSRQKNIEIVTDIHSDLGIYADGDLIERVFINLLANAIAFSPQNAKVVISAFRVEGNVPEVHISVKDFGAGMSPIKLKNLWKEDRKLERSDNKYSTGIGLQYCLWALSAHGSDLKASSTLGEGSEFYFRLPMSKTQTISSVLLPAEAEEIHFEPGEMSALQPWIAQLQEFEIYEGGKILNILDQVDGTKPNILRWKAELQQAVYSINEARFKSLLAIFEP